MLFDSYVFLFLFLPLTLAAFHGVSKTAPPRVAWALLIVASLIYYGYWDPTYVLLITGSSAFNYLLSRRMVSRRSEAGLWLRLGVIANLALLSYYKYANFFVDVLNTVAGASMTLAPIVLPIAISFFTFQQIAYLVDTRRGETDAHNFIDYLLFVSFFPQLIAGPIVHHQEMLPQFAERRARGLQSHEVAIGLATFFIGLAKKVLLADQAAQFSTPIFDAAAQGQVPTLAEGWIAALAYTMQLYFDFSGYSDMAIGLSFMFGIRLPLNFNAPYRAQSIVEFWRRWHMTLSRFLRDYLYISLGGNRRGRTRRYTNLLITMTLGGLWHGAGWTFVVWGVLHGLYLCINHAWGHLAGPLLGKWQSSRGYKLASLVLTFLSVVVAWVLFRAADLATAGSVLASMAGLNGLHFSSSVGLKAPVLWILGLLLVTSFAPTTQQLLGPLQASLAKKEKIEERDAALPGPLPVRLTLKPAWAVAMLGLSLLCLYTLSQGSAREFIYYQF